MITDYLIMAARNITKKRLRSWLTMMGIFVGIAAVVALISIGQGFQRTINEEFEKVGTNRITVQPGSAFGGTPGSSMLSAKLYDCDV
ncbi:peptide ABC transporter permease, partial [Candidatus Woesearchaeota archaeon CG10_big_fil_rev_8_21_14_0_10_47_5]